MVSGGADRSPRVPALVAALKDVDHNLPLFVYGALKPQEVAHHLIPDGSKILRVCAEVTCAFVTA